MGEKLHLGEELALADGGTPKGRVAFDADRLSRHAVCIGMTGSGKTGLCITLIEELALAGVPILALDPKGDLTNLALVFPEHAPADFLPWVDASRAAQAGRTAEAEAAALSATWRKGLAETGVAPGSARRFRDRVEVVLHTPGSRAGVPVDLLGSLGQVPAADVDPETLSDLVQGAVGAVLALVGIQADPLRDPRFVTLARLVEETWAGGVPLSPEALLSGLIDPPFTKVGFFPLEDFFPRKQRMDLALQLNAVLAGSAAAAWREGEPLDIGALLAPVEGRTPVRIFTTAHLDDAGRTLFTTLLLNQLLAWMRRQPGSSGLRALLFMDEVAGLLPPLPAAPPTRAPLLRLLKTARAFGLGVVLATQNPIDLDYSALSNTGLWMLGRLGTRQDQDRLLAGLDAAGAGIDLGALRDRLERLPGRTFLVRDVHVGAPTLWRSRFALSFLRGPLTRAEIVQLAKTTLARPEPASPPAASAAPPGSSRPPPLPAGWGQRWADPRSPAIRTLTTAGSLPNYPRPTDGSEVWAPSLLFSFHLRFDEGRDFFSERTERRLLAPADAAAAIEPAIEDGDLLDSPQTGWFLPLPAHLDEGRELTALQRRMLEDLLSAEVDHLWRHVGLKLSSRAGEEEASFRARVLAAANDRADQERAKVKDKLEERLSRLADKQRKLEADRGRLEADERSRKAAEVVGVGEQLLGLFFGRRASLGSALSRRDSTRRAGERVEKVDQELADLEQEVEDLRRELEDELRAIGEKWSAEAEQVEEVVVRLDKGDLRALEPVLLWLPVGRGLAS